MDNELLKEKVKYVKDFEWSELRIFPKLIGKHESEFPHSLFCDLTVEYYIRIDECITVKITDELLKMWNISQNTLHDIAISNLDPIFRKMTDILPIQMEFEYDIPMIVISSPDSTYGAATIMSPDIFNYFTEDQILLPSSVHEWIAVPWNDPVNVAELNAMVQVINTTELTPRDILSDHIYKLDMGSQKIQTV